MMDKIIDQLVEQQKLFFGFEKGYPNVLTGLCRPTLRLPYRTHLHIMHLSLLR